MMVFVGWPDKKFGATVEHEGGNQNLGNLTAFMFLNNVWRIWIK